MDATDLSENEFAKSHVRHLVGGRGSVDNERLFRFGKLAILKNVFDRGVADIKQSSQRDSVLLPISCAACAQTGTSPCFTIVIMARVSLAGMVDATNRRMLTVYQMSVRYWSECKYQTTRQKPSMISWRSSGTHMSRRQRTRRTRNSCVLDLMHTVQSMWSCRMWLDLLSLPVNVLCADLKSRCSKMSPRGYSGRHTASTREVLLRPTVESIPTSHSFHGSDGASHSHLHLSPGAIADPQCGREWPPCPASAAELALETVHSDLAANDSRSGCQLGRTG